MATSYSYFRTLAPGATVTITDEFEPGKVTGINAKQDTGLLDVSYYLVIGNKVITIEPIRFTGIGFEIPVSILIKDKTPFTITLTNYSAFIRNVSIVLSYYEGIK